VRSFESRTIHDVFEHLLKVVSSARFLRMEGLGNEVPFFICPYRPEQAVDMERVRQQVVAQLASRSISVREVNLYDLTVELLKERGIWEQLRELEPTVGKDELLELLQGVLDTEHHVIPAIAARLAEAPYDVAFLSGVGEVFPYLRSHNVLNNLQVVAKTRPTVLFFPGAYVHSLAQGASLDLFVTLHDDKYYRAFNLFDCEP
jgi:hypothetical protein